MEKVDILISLHVELDEQRTIEKSMQKIVKNNKLYAVVVKNGNKPKNTQFLTDKKDFFQAGFVSQEDGYIAPLHGHTAFREPITRISEYITVIYGKIKVELYTNEQELLEEVILEPGEFIILLRGLHQVIFLERSQIFEIRQGPYHGSKSKTYYSK